MNRSELLIELEALQDKVDKMGFKGQNEHDLHLREEIADWILKGSLLDFLLVKYRDEQMPSWNVPFHYDAEGWAAMKHFNEWVKQTT